MSNKNSNIPDNIMEFEGDRFVEFVKEYAGEKIANLLEFQDITNVDCLLECNDPLEILSFDSDQLIDMKKQTCIKLNGNSYAILPGIKSKMSLLKKALMKKSNYLKKNTKSSSQIISTITSSLTTTTNSNAISSDESTASTPINISSSSAANSKTEEKIKQQINHSLEVWCKKERENEGKQVFQFKEGVDYEIIMDLDRNKTVIKCQCGSTSTLGQKDNRYILSNYIRHLTNQIPCSMVQRKLKNNTGSTLINSNSISNNVDMPVNAMENPTSDSVTKHFPVMARSTCSTALTEEVLLFRNEAFYDLIEQHCGNIILEIIQAQDISSVECLLDIRNIFAFLDLDADELVPLKRKAGILLNDGHFVLKKGIVYKFEKFLSTLQTLNEQNSTSVTHHKSNYSSDLVVPEHLLQRFPFIRTLIIYSSVIVNSKYDFTLINIILNNMIRNLSIDEKGYRYDSIVRQFASSLYILGGRTAYEFVRLNIPGFLPSTQIIQSTIAASEDLLTEGLFNYDGMQDYFNSNQSKLGFCAEDTTAVVSKITYDTTSNTFIGFSLPLDDNGLPTTSSFSTDSFSRFEQWYSDAPKSKSLNACLVQPLSSSRNHCSPYLLAAYGTDNMFTTSNVISRWRHIFEQSKTKDVRIIGFSTDCDSRYLLAMRLSLGFFADFYYDDHPDLFSINLPKHWSWFYMQHEQLYICFQDAVHICTKLRNRLLSKTATLLLGGELINMEPLFYLISNYSKLSHSLTKSDLMPKDRQNYKSAAKISNDNVLSLLESIPNSLGIRIYLQAIKSIRMAYIEKNTHITDRIFHSWTAVFIFRLWSAWISAKTKQDLDFLLSKTMSQDELLKKPYKSTKRQYFITYQAHFSVEINAHSLVYLVMLVSEGQLPTEALDIWLQNSQTCENTFRLARSISSSFSSGVNFTVAQFLNRINKLSVLQRVKDNTHENKLIFPRHHKLSTTSSVNSNLSSTTVPSKTLIEKTVRNAYKFVTDLFAPLGIKDLLRNGRMLPIDELSDIISRRLDEFWSVDIDAYKKVDVDSDTDSDSETDCGSLDDYSDYDSDEELDSNDDRDVIHNVIGPTNRGMRLFDSVKEKSSHSFFKIIIDNEEKFLHKQTGCWLLENDKSSLSADRLSRVQGRQ